MNANQAMSAGRLTARKTAPYFAPLILLLVMRETPGLASDECLGMAVTSTGFLLYDPEAIVQWTSKQLAGVLIHEVLHVWLRHFDRMETFEPDGWNAACDRVINPLVLGMGLDLPAGYLMPSDIGMPEGLTAYDYYRQDARKGKGGGQPAPGQKGRWGKCGSAAGNPVPNEPSPSDFEGKSPGSIERAAKQAATNLTEHARKHAGSMPGELLAHVQAVLAPPKVPWKRRLSVVVRTAVQWRVGATTTRYDGMNRRQAGIGWGAGKPVLPRLREPVCRVAVAVDRSASMRENELVIAVREVAGILKALGASVTLLVFDVAVHRHQEVRQMEEVAKLLHGGSGTDFRPVFDALDKGRHTKPEVVIFLTDGDGAVPQTAPANLRVIWGLIGERTVRPAPWGDVVEIKD